MAESDPPGTTRGDVFGEPPEPHFRRNPEAPFHYAPLVDVRKGTEGLHLLAFVPPAAAPPDVEWRDGEPHLDVWSQGEVLVPYESVERLIRDLASQFRGAVLENLRRDAAREGIEVDDDVVVNGLEDIFALASEREHE